MFMQVYEGHVRHAEPVYVELDQWVKEIAPGTEGWLRSVAGVTEDRRFIGLALWQSASDARRHGSRPDQNHWYQAFSELFTERPLLRESSQVFIDLPGDPEQARFVQVMLGRGTNAGRATELMSAHRDEWAAFRPEVLGTVGCLFDDGTFAMAGYFTDEQAARVGERKQAPPELRAEMDELNSLLSGEPEFFDLHEPWVRSGT